MPSALRMGSLANHRHSRARADRDGSSLLAEALIGGIAHVLGRWRSKATEREHGKVRGEAVPQPGLEELRDIRKTTNGFTSRLLCLSFHRHEHRHGVYSDSASNGASPRDPGSCNSLSRRTACAASSCRRPTCSGSPAPAPSSSLTGTGRPDVYQSSPTSGRWMRKSATTGDGAVPRSRNRAALSAVAAGASTERDPVPRACGDFPLDNHPPG